MLVCVGGAAILLPWLNAGRAVYVCLLASIPVIALLLQRNELVGGVLMLVGVAALMTILREALVATKVVRERMFVMLVLMFFSMLFWAFFEQAGSSINTFTDRNVDRVEEAYVVGESFLGSEIEVPVTQEQVGYQWGGPDLSTLILPDDERGEGAPTAEEMLPDGVFTLTAYDAINSKAQSDAQEANETPTAVVVGWTVGEGHMGMGVAADGNAEIKASVFQSANPVYILMFGLGFSWLWAVLGRRGRDPSTPVKFALGLIQLGLGFYALYYGASHPDGRGMVSLSWLLLGYLLHTTGELCLSPVGLSMVTKLSPKHLVSTVMGAWFLATAFSGFIAGMIAQLTGVGGEGEEVNVLPAPLETLDTYGQVFGVIALLAILSGVMVLVLSPVLKRWMHMSPEETQEASSGH